MLDSCRFVQVLPLVLVSRARADEDEARLGWEWELWAFAPPKLGQSPRGGWFEGTKLVPRAPNRQGQTASLSFEPFSCGSLYPASRAIEGTGAQEDGEEGEGRRTLGDSPV